ncbi:MAG: invasion associated locus B family protein [Pseudomonadota bacterium]
MFNSGLAKFGLIAGLAAFSSVAVAQENPTPSRSVESFQSWTLECNNIKVQSEGGEESYRRICEVIQPYINQQARSEVARLVFGFDEKEPEKLVGAIRTIVNVSFESGPSILEGDTTRFIGKFNRCAGTFCYAIFDINAEGFAEFQASKNSRLQYALANGSLLTIPVNKAGLADAMKALRSRAASE